MSKRIFLLILMLACAGFIGFVFWKFNKEKVQRGDPFSVVLDRAEAILEIDALQELENFESIVEQLSFAFYINSDSVLLAPPIHFANLLHQTGLPLESLPDEIANDPVVFSWFGNDVCIAYGIEEAQAAHAVASCFPGLNFTHRNFHGIEIMEAGFQSNVRYTVLTNVLVISNTSSLIEETILNHEKKNSPPLLLQKAREVSAADVPIHIYCNLDNGEWLQLDPQLTETSKSLAGYALLNENSRHRFSLLDKKTESNLIVLPLQASVLEIFSYNSFEEGWKKSEDFFANSDRSKFWGQAWKDFGDSCQCDLNETMLSWRANSWGSFLMNTDSISKPVLFFTVRDSIDVLKLMHPLIPENNIDDGTIAHFPYPQLWDRNNTTSMLVTPNYIMQQENLVLLAEDVETLIRILRTGGQPKAINDSFTLRQDECIVNPLPDVFMRMMHEMGFSDLNVSHFKENKYLVNFTGNAGSSDSSTTSPDTAAVEVNANIDTALIGKWEVKNHITGEKEFLVQNANNEITLHEKSANGKELWKVKFFEPLRGDVIQIDAFKNGKLQMMMLTSKAIHCLDRNGNEVAGYPVMLPFPASSALAVFDYDNKKNYRIIVGCENKKIYNHTIDCKQAEGWTPPAFNSTLASIHHLRIKGDDFLIALFEDRSIDVLKRTGKEIFTAKQKLPENFKGMQVNILPGSTIESSSIMLHDGGQLEVMVDLKR